MASYLITGSSRGLGLALATLLASKPASEVSQVFASARSESAGIRDLVAKSEGRVHFIPLEVTSFDSAEAAAQQVDSVLGGKGLDVLVNNAGIMTAALNGIDAMLVGSAGNMIWL